MPAMDYQDSATFTALGRSILSLRREQVHSVDGGHRHPLVGSYDVEIEAFQKRVAGIFLDLASSFGDELLSLPWLCKLLDGFLVCQDEFQGILFGRRDGRQAQLSHPPLDRFLSDFFERSVKALDVCNAIREGVDKMRQWRQHLEIAISALRGSRGGRPLGEGQIRRACKALNDLTILLLDEKESPCIFNLRNRSFGRGGGKEMRQHRRVSSAGSASSSGHHRSLSWSVSRSWSAARQLQAIGNNFNVPRGNEVAATNGLVVPVFVMSSVLFFVMWALVAAIPCQDRGGLQTHFSLPKNFPWTASITALHEKIFEESKKKDRKNSCGLLKEILQMEKCSRQLVEVLDPVEFPLTEEKETQLQQGVEGLLAVCNALKEGLDPLERQVRDIFLRIVSSRTEGLDCLSKSHHSE